MTPTRSARRVSIGALLVAALASALLQVSASSADAGSYATTVDRRDDVQRKNLDTGQTETLTGAAATGSGVEVTSTQVRYLEGVVQIRVQLQDLGPDVNVRGQIRSASRDFAGPLSYYAVGDVVTVKKAGNAGGPECGTVEHQPGSRGVITIRIPDDCTPETSYRLTATATTYTACSVDGSEARYQCADPVSATSTTTASQSTVVTSPTTSSITTYDRAGDVFDENGELGAAASASSGLDVRTAVFEHRKNEFYVRVRFVNLQQGQVGVSGSIRGSGQAASTSYGFTTFGTGTLKIIKMVDGRVASTCNGSARWVTGKDGLVYVSVPRACVGSPAVGEVGIGVDREDRELADIVDDATWLSRSTS